MKLELPRNPFDFKRIRQTASKVNALLNCKIFNANGDQIGRLIPSDGNTAIQLDLNDRWQKPNKELDSDVSVAKGTWVYISPNNDLVLTGLTDRLSLANVKSYPGIWEAAQDVPAASAGAYNVPTTDYPATTPSGSPLAGDLDDADVFWILICPTCGL